MVPHSRLLTAKPGGFGAFGGEAAAGAQRAKPADGKTVAVSETVIPTFKIGQEMRARLNPRNG